MDTYSHHVVAAPATVACQAKYIALILGAVAQVRTRTVSARAKYWINGLGAPGGKMDQGAVSAPGQASEAACIKPAKLNNSHGHGP